MSTLIPVLDIHQGINRCHTGESKSTIRMPKCGESVVLGRLELLSCWYAACGCSRNIYSTQGKCRRCQKIEWAVRRLSRKMVRISRSVQTGSLVLSYRGKHATVLVKTANDRSNDMATDCKEHKTMAESEGWRGNIIISSGMRLCFKESDGDRLLEFRLTDGVTLKLYMVPCGCDLPKQRIELLKSKLQEKNIIVVDEFIQASHLIISRHVKDLRHLAELLGRSETKLQSHLDTNRVQCLLPAWISQCPTKPSPHDFWLGYCPRSANSLINGTNHKRLDQSLRRQEMPPLRRNQHLADHFLRLSKFYDDAPMHAQDEFRALQFHKLAGRLQSLDFDVTAENIHEVSSRLKAVPAVGKTGLDMIHEIFDEGTIRRTELMERDPARLAIRNLTGIHGIGRVKALNLYRQGYKDIGDIRQAASAGTLSLTREEAIGVECYEDFLEDIPRNEAEQIEKNVFDAFQAVSSSPGEIAIMGSYRRGQQASGDVDILITMENHKERVPSDLLSQMIQYLDQKGNIAHHITCIGEPARNSNRSGADVARHPQTKESKDSSVKRGFSKTYMGVFNSPQVPGKYRRVDIKIYPYNQKFFAYLHFSNGKWFNRSMGLWATKKFNWKLSDGGLVEVGTGKVIMDKANSEKEVFEKLALRYKEPSERLYFDDVEPSNSK